GAFTAMAGIGANYIARWNGAIWSPLGAGTTGYVRAITTLANGDVIAAGSFAGAGNISINLYLVARWNGAAWSAVGTGMTGDITALTTASNGDIVAGGV